MIQRRSKVTSECAEVSVVSGTNRHFLTLSELEKQVTGLQGHLLRSSGNRLEGSQRFAAAAALLLFDRTL